jgi:hypothetical protein
MRCALIEFDLELEVVFGTAASLLKLLCSLLLDLPPSTFLSTVLAPDLGRYLRLKPRALIQRPDRAFATRIDSDVVDALSNYFDDADNIIDNLPWYHVPGAFPSTPQSAPPAQGSSRSNQSCEACYHRVGVGVTLRNPNGCEEYREAWYCSSKCMVSCHPVLDPWQVPS